MTQVQFKPLHPSARVPVRGSAWAGGYDITSTGAVIQGLQVIVSTGLSVAFDAAWVMKIYGRSGLAFKHDISLTNGVGIIDADYRGEIKLSFSSTTRTPEEMLNVLGAGNRVAQLMMHRVEPITWKEVEYLPDTVRGEGGFGSTGS